MRTARARARKLAKAREAEISTSKVLHQRFATHDPRGPRPELIHCAQREETPEVPTLTLPLSNEFLGPQLVIHETNDLQRLVEKCFGERYHPGAPCRYFCPRHAARDERTLTLVDHPGTTALIHCSKCGCRWTVLEFLHVLFPDQEKFLAVARYLWPEKVWAGQIDASEFHGLQVQSIRRAIFETGRFPYFEWVDGKEVDVTFDDWAGVSAEALAALLARESLPVEMPPDWYLLNVLRSWSGEIAAVDVYTLGFEPLFRSWLPSEASFARPELFVVPTWCDHHDRSRERLLCRCRDDAHAQEKVAAATPVERRQPIWLCCPPQPVVPELRPPYDVCE